MRTHEHAWAHFDLLSQHFLRRFLNANAEYQFAGAGWFNLLGQAAVTAGIDFTLANHLAAMWLLSSGKVFTQGELLATYAGAAQASPSTAKIPKPELLGACSY